LTLLSLSYLLVATLSRVGNLDKLVSLPWATGHIAAGCLGGLLVAFVGTAVRRRYEPDQVRAARAPMPIRPILASLRSFDERTRDGVRRTVPLAILMFFFQLNGGRDAFWAFFAAYLVLLTPGKTPRSRAAARVGSTLFGVLLLAVASLIVPNQVLFSLGLIILFSGVGLSPAYPVIGGGLTTIGSVLLAGAPTGAIGTWSTHRLLDTVVGCAIALVANYLFWPRDNETPEPVPVASNRPGDSPT
jgi:uncharacterized membrane protein YccC